VLKIVAQGGEGATTSAGVALAAGPLTQRSEALDTLLIAGGLSLSALAHQAGMSKRSFSRHYTEAAGQTPARGIERLGLEAAQNQLLESGLPVKRIALRCGFG
jgi:transcriptional regulator GlxA family with amidase domain